MSDLKNPTIPTYQTISTIGCIQYMAIPTKCYQKMHPNHLVTLGNYVTLSYYVDANLMHDVTTGNSVTGILHLINKTSLDWYSKKQATVETATYGSEFVAAIICVEQIIDLVLRCLGVPVREKNYMFGDNSR
jgi:hypothetical protein